MNAVEERCDNRLFIDDEFNKELNAYIMAEDSGEKSSDRNSTTSRKVTMRDKCHSKDVDKDLNELLESIERGQLKANNEETKSQAHSVGSRFSDSSEVVRDHSSERVLDKCQAEDMDVFVLPESGSTKPTHLATEGDLSSDNDDEHDYELTEDQKRASQELEQLIAETEGFPDEEPPEYDMKDRIRQLNAELAIEPMPDKRSHKVMFKDDPVDLVVPPADWEDRSAEEEPRRDQLDAMTNKPSNKSQDTVNSNSSDSPKEESKHKVLIERDGKFELISADDIRARDLGMQLQIRDVSSVQPEKSEDLTPSNLAQTDEPDKESSVIVSPRPPSAQRPSSGYLGGHRSVRSASQRPHSATVVDHGSPLKNFSYVSPYGLTDHEKKQLQEGIKRRETRERNMKAKKKEEDRLKRKENEEAFDAWLKRKQNSVCKTRTDSQEAKPEVGNPTNYFREWLQVKKEQNKREKLLKQREEEERRCSQPSRSQRECDQAFKQWLRKKNHDAWHRRGLERQKYGMLLSAKRLHKPLTPLQLANFYRLLSYHTY